MEGIVAGALAVMGTLLGVVVAHRYQEKAFYRAESRAQDQRQHDRLFDRCADFIGLSEDYRRAQLDRWLRRHEDPDGEAATAARTESYRLYVETRSSACRLKLASNRQDVRELADQANAVLELTIAIIATDSRSDMLQRGEAAKHACDAFVVTANAVLHSQS
ncbi:hypothetical protein AB0C95_08730 [Streptomyces caniferus]|uniref:hypothetical protein n=1 Tax=Streptomyces caniferus TaxID=285557 RepID=UPI0033C7555A